MAAGQWGPVDVLVLVLYFAGLAAVGLWASRRAQAAQSAHGASHDDYFLAERSVPYWAVAASLFASNIGAEHFVGLAGTAAYSGIAVGWYEWGAMPNLLLLGFFFLPVYMRARVTTMPDWVERRYGPFCRTFLVAVSLLLYIFTKISATLFAGDLIIAEISDVNRVGATIVLIVATALYTVTGGMAAVIYTEALQTCILIAGGLSLLAVGMFRVGGLPGLHDRIQHDPMYFHIFRPASDATFPWTGFVFGYYCVSLWYWATDQVIVQRALAAKNVEHGQAGCIGGGFLKLLPGFIMVLPGMVGRALMQERGVVTPFSDKREFDRTFPWMVMNVMPENTRGVIVAAMLSALMSSLASVFNSSATIFTMNVYARARGGGAGEAELVWTGRATVVVMAVLSILWLPLIPLFGEQLFLYIQKPPAFVAPPILAIFVWGFLFRWVTSEAAAWGLTLGVAVGMARFVLEIVDGALGGTAGGALHAFVSFNFLHFASVSFVASSCLILGISWLRPEDRAWGEEDLKMLWRRGLYEELMREEDSAWERLAKPGEEEPELPTSQASKVLNYRQAQAWTEVELSAVGDLDDDDGVDGAAEGQPSRGGNKRESEEEGGRDGRAVAQGASIDRLEDGLDAEQDARAGEPTAQAQETGVKLNGTKKRAGEERESLLVAGTMRSEVTTDAGESLQGGHEEGQTGGRGHSEGEVDMDGPNGGEDAQYRDAKISFTHASLHHKGECCTAGLMFGSFEKRKKVINLAAGGVLIAFVVVLICFR